ncbi:MAG: hypothetical protein Q9208_008557 [Pyrenodesmia sp. 3 TL-2023]
MATQELTIEADKEAYMTRFRTAHFSYRFYTALPNINDLAYRNQALMHRFVLPCKAIRSLQNQLERAPHTPLMSIAKAGLTADDYAPHLAVWRQCVGALALNIDILCEELRVLDEKVMDGRIGWTGSLNLKHAVDDE